MQTTRLQKWVRLTLILCGAGLIAVLFFPMWRIDLAAPQYPEGLRLLIYPNNLGGNVDIINGLNHYIGMKTLHTADFMEFTVLPYIIVFFAVACIFVAIMGRKKLLNILFALFVCFGILAMYDFWRWEYNYGHNLNPEAAIIVPGMAYQPPLIGFKQLLNFGAYSVPDIGGWIFLAAGALLLLLVIIEWRASKKIKRNRIDLKTITALVLLSSMMGCTTGPEPLKQGKDICSFCKMTISDNRFGAELVTHKGKVYKFDDSHCLLSFLATKTVSQGEIANVYFTDFGNDHSLLKAENAFLLRCENLKGPMNGDIIAFSNEDSMKKTAIQNKGIGIDWNQLNK